MVKLLISLDFVLRIKGSHHTFSNSNVEEIINIQPIGSKAKAYQVKQVREIIIKYKLVVMIPKYEIIIYWSQEDESFIAEVPELPGCMSDGKSHQEALKNVEQIISEWIETAIELGRTIPSPKGKPMYA
ncbi:MAG: type toxin-antitoxin system HicB family antitoxin [Segetibacter sp.]|nr:type toxin-antitoxin system HicB family antitoxin [Segetibacter sp.]